MKSTDGGELGRSQGVRKSISFVPNASIQSFVFELWQAVQILVAMAPQIVAFTLQQFSERILNLDG